MSGTDALFGLDVSSAQGEVRWDSVAASAGFVLLRALQGCAEDSRFRENMLGVSRAGLPFGLYFASSGSGCQGEAEAALRLCREFPPVLGAWYDMELPIHRRLSKAAFSAQLLGWLAALSHAGFAAGVYTNPSMYASHILRSEVGAFPLWLAAYPSGGRKTFADAPSARPAAELWQWTDSGAVGGIAAAVDLDMLFAPPRGGLPVRAGERIEVYSQSGEAERGRYIAPGDVCLLSRQLTCSGLVEVAYPTASGRRTAYLRLSGALKPL